MNQKQQFFTLLVKMRNRIWLQNIVISAYAVLFTVSAPAFLIVIFSRFVVVTHLSFKLLLLIPVAVLLFIGLIFYRKPSFTETAKAFDVFVLGDRVITAFEHIDSDQKMMNMQRADAIKRMKEAMSEVRSQKVQFFYLKKLTASVVLSSVIVLSFLFPNSMMEKEEQLEREETIAVETKEKVKKLVEEQKPKLNQEAEEALQKLEENVKETKDAEKILEKLLETEKKLAELQKEALNEKNNLQELARSLQNQKLNDTASSLNELNKEKLQKALEKLQKELKESNPENRKELLADLQKLMNAVGAENQPSLESLNDEQLKEVLVALEKQLQGKIDQAAAAGALADANSELLGLAEGLNNEMIAANLSTGALTFSNNPSSPNGSNGGQPAGNTAAPGNGRQPNSGQNPSNGSGNGSGQGNGSGSGSGQGSGSGSGFGGGTGGTGAGSGQGEHSLLTVPKQLDGKQNSERDGGQLNSGDGELQTAPNSPILPGEAREYESVYGNYETTYRESMERMDLPNHLEEVVKQYFSDLEPREE
ncbi:coiled-coil domain-containing protein [Bacillus taeanensis]|uniref:Uncharacterized protein n=1 Tax=Bacillus taeanensis TaxID=273032 RepID=A0A366XU60_9BACI|nr:hypothetical protein [Bacillus taeanensis]RBW67683.1 hypothetical protein DS031_20640 [Bacillus taeanensis]